MTRRVLIAAGLVAALVGGSAVAIAQPPRGGPGFHGPGGRRGPGFLGGPMGELGLRGVDLTDAQREQVRTIMESHRDAFQQLAEKLRAAHRGFAEAIQAETLDESAIRTQSATVANAMADEGILRAKVRAEVFAILTAEQQQTLKERQAAKEARRKQR